MARRGFGTISKSRGGRYRARYSIGGMWTNAPTSFRTKAEAERWLATERNRLEARSAGTPAPKPKAPTLSDYSTRWLAERPIRPSTARTYGVYLDRHIRPVLGGMPLDRLTADHIKAWHNNAAPDAPTVRARSYALLKTILASAVEDGLVPVNPCRIRGAGNVRPAVEVVTATPAQVAELAEAMPAPYSLAILLGAWCQLRAGETLALRRRDVDTRAGLVHVRRGVTWQGQAAHFGPPKTNAGIRSVHMPRHVVAAVEDHLEQHVGPTREALLFPREPGSDVPVHLSTFSTQMVKRAVKATDLPETFRYHHLRHSGLTMLASAGASVAELQARAGHATPGIAIRYQHARAERDRALAERLDDLVE